MNGGQRCLVAALAVAILPALLGFPGTASASGRRPDLVISGGKLRGEDPFVFYGGAHQPSFSLTTVTANRGAAAGPTVTTVYLEHGGRRWRLADRSVPALGSGAQDRGRPHLVREPRMPLGDYKVVACADAKSAVAEGNERNNCRQIADHFYVISTGWDGTVDGSATLGALINSGPIPGDHSLESWHSDDVDFFFDEYRGNGRFSYDLIRATVEYRDAGGADTAGCTYSGGGTEKAAGGTFITDYSSETYTGIIGMSTFYEIEVSCPDLSNLTLEGPHESEALSTTFFGRQSARDQSLPFGAFKLTGTNTAPELGSSWKWSLEAPKP